MLSDRRNIVVIADEAHRSQYDFVDGFRGAHAGCVAERVVYRIHRDTDLEAFEDRKHDRSVFGDYISILRHPTVCRR